MSENKRRHKDRFRILPEWKKLWNIKVMVIPIIIRILGMVSKDQRRNQENWRLEEELKPSRPQYCWNLLEHLEDSWGPKETCCHSDLKEKPPVKTCVKNLHRVKMIKKKKITQLATWNFTTFWFTNTYLIIKKLWNLNIRSHVILFFKILFNNIIIILALQYFICYCKCWYFSF